ncbi:Oidioi.mRNA.OKI2018_I69.XSR.g13802.t1.cds [Oikopleura dioica]|uniref:Oidioi.mRNA.OKI2018_I69.XSR.g13802.t1.cds n=1 Tax=Oikopleura dioica TaxID=34765 RepID=A0ABN7S9N6_OIKDI|nr:Oidioi.mRNA.OKI2018_I69.XSR.g13802.t1.cds [Oikopleura dioica]
MAKAMALAVYIPGLCRQIESMKRKYQENDDPPIDDELAIIRMILNQVDKGRQQNINDSHASKAPLPTQSTPSSTPSPAEFSQASPSEPAAPGPPTIQEAPTTSGTSLRTGLRPPSQSTPSSTPSPAEFSQASPSEPAAPGPPTIQEAPTTSGTSLRTGLRPPSQSTPSSTPSPAEFSQASPSEPAAPGPPTIQEAPTTSGTSRRAGLRPPSKRKRTTAVQEQASQEEGAQEFALDDEVFPASSKKKKSEKSKPKAQKAASRKKAETSNTPKNNLSTAVKTSPNMPQLINVTENNGSRKFLIDENGVRREYYGCAVRHESDTVRVYCTATGGQKKKCSGRHILKLRQPDIMKTWYSSSDGRPVCKLNIDNASTLKRENYEIIESISHSCLDQAAVQDQSKTPRQDEGPTSEQDQAATSEEGATGDFIDLTDDDSEPDVKTEKNDSA